MNDLECQKARMFERLRLLLRSLTMGYRGGGISVLHLQVKQLPDRNSIRWRLVVDGGVPLEFVVVAAASLSVSVCSRSRGRAAYSVNDIKIFKNYFSLQY